MKNLINHYEHFYTLENGTFEDFCEWARENDNSISFAKFKNDLLDSEVDLVDIDTFVYDLILNAGILAHAYELLKYNINDESFDNFYKVNKNTKEVNNAYKIWFNFEPCEMLSKQFKKRWFVKSRLELTKLHCINILSQTKKIYENYNA